jgi:hypothetical protein
MHCAAAVAARRPHRRGSMRAFLADSIVGRWPRQALFWRCVATSWPSLPSSAAPAAIILRALHTRSRRSSVTVRCVAGGWRCDVSRAAIRSGPGDSTRSLEADLDLIMEPRRIALAVVLMAAVLVVTPFLFPTPSSPAPLATVADSLLSLPGAVGPTPAARRRPLRQRRRTAPAAPDFR